MVHMEDYSHLCDEELQKLFTAGDLRAGDVLAFRYSELAENCARSYYMAGADNSDLVQEGMFGLVSAIRNYTDSRGVSFRTYAETCIRRRIFSAIRSAARLKHTPLNNGVSLEEAPEAPIRDNTVRIVPEQRRTPEEQVLARESAKEFSSFFTRYLSQFEQDVLRLYLDGYSYHSMARELGREEKAVDNAVQRIRRKLSRIYSTGDFSES
ncbi:MAG: sigma-70 family RNA polymerase sigma factor [Oscillospiraceae bacterium]|nr:sigma-70 family RNA polymerase sigma factor [Oscillospiraceae bacterium]